MTNDDPRWPPTPGMAQALKRLEQGYAAQGTAPQRQAARSPKPHLTPGIVAALRAAEARLAEMVSHHVGPEPQPDYDDTEGAEAYGADAFAWEAGRDARPALAKVRRALRYAEGRTNG